MNEDYIEENMPVLGDAFPQVQVKTTHGSMNLPDDYSGKWFVLFSHPGDFTPVCTTEFIGFAKRHDEFKKIGCELIGLSIDQVYSHIKWVEWIKEKMDVEIKYPVIADEMGRLAQILGMIHPSKGTNTVRAVFIVDPKGIVRTMIYYPQEIGRNIDEILRTVKALQTSDKNKVACPENWPNNEILGEKVIMPPPQDEKTANERRNQSNCYDWWFCTKEL
ncbi:MAG: peroxiredoxin [Candidatus Nanoarchaeia archaeon]